MNRLILSKVLNHQIFYLYQPEGKGDFGEVVYDRNTKTTDILKFASEDNENHSYAQKASFKVAQLVEENELPLDCVQAWY